MSYETEAKYQKVSMTSWTIVREYRGTVGRRKVSDEELNEFKQSQEYKDDIADGFHFSFIRNKE